MLRFISPLAALSLAACATVPAPWRYRAKRSDLAPDNAGLSRTLSSDAFEGREPGTPGEEETVAYLVEAFPRRRTVTGQ